MFHRVKSENPQTPETPAQGQQQSLLGRTETQQAPAAQPRQEKPAAPISNDMQPATPQSQPKTQETFYQKETQTMTENAQKKNETQTQDATAPRAMDIPGGNAFQRQGQQPGWNAGNYPAAGYAAGGMHSPGMNAQSTDNKLTIGRGITMAGEIKSCNHLVVEGTVEATLTGASVLEIAQSGTFFGTVEIEEATVAGNFEGDLTVNGRLVVRSSGNIKGTITYKELEVEAGAVLEGRISPTSSTGQSTGRGRNNKQPAKPGATAAQKEAANNETQGLFGGNNAAAAE